MFEYIVILIEAYKWKQISFYFFDFLVFFFLLGAV